MSSSTLPRTQPEIRARFDAVRPVDVLGFKAEVLAECMSFEAAEGIRKDGITAEEWGDPPTLEQLTVTAREYLGFAIEKIQGHRGISASRSVAKLEEYAWLLGRDDIVKAMDEADYPQYGAPKVKAFAEGMGWWADPGEILARMADGLPCEDECVEGCGR